MMRRWMSVWMARGIAIGLVGLLGILAGAGTAEEKKEKAPTEREMRGWIGELRSLDAVARDLAAQRLIGAGNAALPHVKRLLGESTRPATHVLARRVYSAIVGLSPEDAGRVERTLQPLDDDETPDLHRVARQVLGLGDAAVDYTLRRMGSDRRHGTRAAFRRHLSTLVAVRDLAEGRNREDRASVALTGVGESVLAELRTVAEQTDLDSAWRTVAAERLMALGGPASIDASLGLARDRDPAVRGIVVPTLCRTAPPGRYVEVVDAVAVALVEDDWLRADLALYGERIELKTLRKHLDHRKASIQGWTSFLLGERRDAEAGDRLARLLRSKSSFVVEEAVRALGRIGDGDHLDALTGSLDHSDPSVRRALVTAIAGLDAEDTTAWMAVLLKDQDASVRATAATMLGHGGNESAVGPLVASLDDPDASVTAAASASLSLLTGESLATALAVSGDRRRAEIRSAWTGWWDRAQSESGSEDEDEEEKGDPATALASDGARILRTVAAQLRRTFRPYGELKKKNGTAIDKLCRAAQERMRKVLARTDDEEGLVLELEEDGKKILDRLLTSGTFRTPDELARMVGAFPVDLTARDYILLVYEAADGMVDSLGDRFTRLSSLEDPDGKVEPDQLPSLFGQGKSLGMFLDEVEGGYDVEFVFALSPADRAGLRRGDRVLSINGELAAGLAEAKVQKLLREPVDLSVLRDGWTRPVSFHLEPAVTEPDDLVTHCMLPGKIGYVRLQQFDLGCSQKIEWALRELEKEGARALVLDLRGNPGGTVLDAHAIVDKFVPAGETISINWYNTEEEGKEYREEELPSSDSDTDRDYPLAVLINECSASASEMTSGSLQDLERAVIVGRTSWGKGIGQGGSGITGFPRSSIFGETRSSLSLGITLLEYFLPTGRSIQGVGVVPDLPVELPSLLGERFELVRRVMTSETTTEYVDQLLADDPEKALALARYDAWDEEEYPDFDAFRAKLRLELSPQLVRKAVREVLRRKLIGDHPEFAIVDVQQDEDVRAAVAALAADLELALEEIPEYEDLAE